MNYNTADPFNTPCLEIRGIPNILKQINNIIFNKITENNFNSNEYVFDYNYINFKVKSLRIILVNRTQTAIYGLSQSGNFIYDSLYCSQIKLEFDFNNFNSIELKRVLLHELLHIYELYQRFINYKKENNDFQWMLAQYIGKIRSKYSSDKFMNDFIYCIYLSFDIKLDKSAYLIIDESLEFNERFITKYDDLLMVKSLKYKKDRN